MMPLNMLIATLALENLGKYNPDSSLYDAIVEMDEKLVKYLCNKKYRLEILNKGFIKEPVDMVKMIEIIENNLFKNSKIRMAY